jgi:hypothetical protein
MKKIFTIFCFLLAGLSMKGQLSVNASATTGCAPLNGVLTFSDPNASSYFITIQNYQGYYTNFNTASNSYSYSLTSGGNYYIDVYGLDGFGNTISYGYAYANVYGISSYIYGSAQQGACPGDQVYFDVQTYNNGGNASYDWDLGNGTTYSQIPYSYVYTSYPTSGSYTITVNATVGGCGTYSLTDTIVVSATSGAIPQFSTYIWPNDSVCPGDPIYIGGPNTGYTIWNYGDGSSYSGQYGMEHSYNNPGTYYTTVTTVNGCGNSYTVQDTITVTTGLTNSYSGNLYFSMSDTVVCPNTEVHFYGNNSAQNVKWKFTSTDSTTITNPERSFPVNGIYPIYYTVYNGCGSPATISRNLYVVDTISASPFTITSTDSICPGSAFMLDFNFNGNYPYGAEFTYNMGDTVFTTGSEQNQAGYIYDSPGTYTMNISYLNGCGNTATATHQIYVGSAAGTQANTVFFGTPQEQACPGDTMFFMVFPGGGTNNYNIDFGDGTTPATSADLLYGPDGMVYNIYRHVYAVAGAYTANCTVSSQCGGSIVMTQTVSVHNSAPLNDAGFFYDDQKYYCLGDPISFFAYGASQFEWDFGDGSGTLQTNGVLQPVIHAYTTPGYYKVKLIVTNGCGLKDTNENFVNVPDTRININTNSVSSSCGVSNGKAIAIASGGSLPYTYTWTNGDNSFLADSLPSGIYVVNIEDKNGCKNFSIATVSDIQAPTILVNNVINASCNNGADGVIDITVIGSSGPYTFAWSNGKTSEDINNLVAGPYEITVTDANGCVATKSIQVSQPDPFVVSFSPTQPSCGSSNGMLVANVLGNSGPYSFIWETGLNSSTISGIPAGTYDLVVVDSKGCLKQVTALLNNQGSPAVGLDSVGALNCGTGGAAIYVTAMSSSNPLTYAWTNGSASYSTADITGITGGTYTLTVTDINGCQAFKVVEVAEQQPESNPICLVTVDTTSFTNKVVWEEVTQPDLASYNIYRESSQAGLYYLVGNVHKDSLHQFIDPVADPNVRPWRYKISSVSNCGSESTMSDFHKTIHLTINQGLTDSTYNLIWDNYEGQTTYTTFYIWRYKNTTGWTKLDSISKTDHSYTDFVNGFSQLTDLYYFVEAGPLSSCDPTRAVINTSRSNIKQIVATTSQDTTSAIGMGEQEFNDDFFLYPNPTKGLITLKTGKDFGKTLIEVTNVLGQVVYAENSILTSKIIDLGHLANGVYFVKVYKGNKAITRKVMLSK